MWCVNSLSTLIVSLRLGLKITMSASEPTANTGAFGVTRVGSTANALTVSVVLSGTASEGLDYQTIGTTVEIPAGSATATILVTPLDDALEEARETVIATLSSGAGYVAVAPANATVSIEDDDLVLIFDEGATWSYFEGPGGPGVGWNDLDFDVTAWQSGPTGIGYGDGDDMTELTGMANGYLTLYLRRAFLVADAPSVSGLRFSVDYDDGFVAFINGMEIARRGVPLGQDSSTTAVNH